MKKSEHHPAPSGNKLLDSLPQTEYRQIIPFLKRVELKRGEIIHPARHAIEHVYFPTSGLLSLMVSSENGDAIEAAVYGNEAVASLPVFLGAKTPAHRVEVRIPGAALRMKTEDFKRFSGKSKKLRSRLCQYANAVIAQLAQTAFCNRFHSVEERMSRWLLTAQDGAHSDRLPVTREVLAAMIGARRPRVSTMLARFNKAGLVRARRGAITIIDRQGLIKTSCECYGILKEQIDHFLDPQK
jgi:CRP-like cAMP-binding protein